MRWASACVSRAAGRARPPCRSMPGEARLLLDREFAEGACRRTLVSTLAPKQYGGALEQAGVERNGGKVSVLRGNGGRQQCGQARAPYDLHHGTDGIGFDGDVRLHGMLPAVTVDLLAR